MLKVNDFSRYVLPTDTFTSIPKDSESASGAEGGADDIGGSDTEDAYSDKRPPESAADIESSTTRDGPGAEGSVDVDDDGAGPAEGGADVAVSIPKKPLQETSFYHNGEDPERGWTPRILSKEATERKMRKNELKAISEHRARAPTSDAFITPEQFTEEEQTPSAAPLTYHVTFSAEQSHRSAMEDAHFIQETGDYLLAGVFDGHGGALVSNYARDHFNDKFIIKLMESKGNVHHAFEATIYELQQEIKQQQLLGGSTAVISFIDKKTNTIYTATLADAEANIYRTIGEQHKSIPLSCVRDFGSEKDFERALQTFSEKSRTSSEADWRTKQPKKRYFPSATYGINVSRALGDFDLLNAIKLISKPACLSKTAHLPGIIPKPKITIAHIKPGDTIVLACDGLKDYAASMDKHDTEEQIINTIYSDSPDDRTLAQKLCDKAVSNMSKVFSDNVTVIAITIAS